MDPGTLPRAVQWSLPDLLDSTQLMQGQGKGMDGVVKQGGGCIKVPRRNIDVCYPQLLVKHALHDAVDDVLNLRLVNIDHSERCDVCSTIFEVIKVDGVSIKTGEEEIVALADQANLLALDENLLQNFLLTFQNNQFGLSEHLCSHSHSGPTASLQV